MCPVKERLVSLGMCWPRVSGVPLLEVAPGAGAARPGAWQLVPEGTLGSAEWQVGTILEGENTPPPPVRSLSMASVGVKPPSAADSITWCQCSLQLGLSCGSRLGVTARRGAAGAPSVALLPTAQHCCHLVDVSFHTVILTLSPQLFPHHTRFV